MITQKIENIFFKRLGISKNNFSWNLISCSHILKSSEKNNVYIITKSLKTNHYHYDVNDFFSSKYTKHGLKFHIVCYLFLIFQKASYSN